MLSNATCTAYTEDDIDRQVEEGLAAEAPAAMARRRDFLLEGLAGTLRLPGVPVLTPQAAKRGDSDAVFEPIFANQDPELTGDLDSLYAYATANEVRPKTRLVRSDYQDKLCATRWHDPDPERTQGRVMWFGFPMYYMEDTAALTTLQMAIDWFREEEPPSLTPVVPFPDGLSMPGPEDHRPWNHDGRD